MSSTGRQDAPDHPPKAARTRETNASSRVNAGGVGGVCGPRVIWSIAVLLAILHQDFWLWGDRRLLLGFLPSGMAYHIAFSIAVAGLWALALRYAWPSEWEAWAEEPSDQ